MNSTTGPGPTDHPDGAGFADPGCAEVLADLGRARSIQVARALGLEASTVTRLAGRLVAAGHVTRGSEPGHRGVVTLELTATGQELVSQVAAWRQQELSRILQQLPPPAGS